MMFDPILDFFRGKAVTIPPMDGALRPNTALDDAEILMKIEAPDNLVSVNEKLFFTSGEKLLVIGGKQPLASFSAPITAVAVSQNEVFAVGLNSGRIEFHNSDLPALEGFNCPVAMVFNGPDELLICNGSQQFKPSDWASDLMHKNASGSVWSVNLKSGERCCLVRNLAFPYGIATDPEKARIIVSESWKHRLISIPFSGGSPSPVLSKLAGYPARIFARSSGGYILSLFAPRNRLIEFVLLEDDYRTAMMKEFDSRYWIAPSLAASKSFLEPLQSGGVKTMGIHKPWSPSRSYGLVATLDKNFAPTDSFHSRANGTRHGITSAIEFKNGIAASSKGGDMILQFAFDGKKP